MTGTNHPPILTLHDGGQQPADFDAQERAAWAALAEGYEKAFNCLCPSHPERGDWQQRWHRAVRVAGLPAPRPVRASRAP